jgi:hypothetical protein
MEKGFTVLAVIGVLIALVGIVLSVTLPPEFYVHSGKYLMDETTYQSFKIDMAQDDVNIITMNVLNDGYPKLVDYSYESNCDMDNYKGNVSNGDINKTGETVAVIGVILAFAAVGTLFIFTALS